MKQKQPRWLAMKLETQGIKKVMGLGANKNKDFFLKLSFLKF